MLGINSIERPMNRVNCNLTVKYNPGIARMAEEEPDALADALNAINRANLRGLATADQWTDLVNEYFVYAEEEEGHEEEEGGETEPPEPEEDPPYHH